MRLCGAFVDTTANDTLLAFQGGGAPGNPVTLLFDSGATLTNTAYWGGSNGAIHSNGYSDIVVDGGPNGPVQNTGNGSALPNQHDTRGVVIESCSGGCQVKNLHVDNLYVHIPGTSAASQGEDGPGPGGIASGISCDGCSNSILGPGNEAHDDFIGVEFHWSSPTNTNMEIYGNTVSRCNWGILAAGVSGVVDGIRIHDNDVSDAYVWDDWMDGNHHNGIFVFETGPASTIKNLQQYNNYIHGNMSALCSGIISHATGFIFNDYNGGTWVAPLTFNNVIANTNASCGPANGMLTLISNSGSGSVYNNTFTGRGSAVSVTGTLIFTNNLVSKTDLGLSNLNGTIAAADYNLYFGLTGASQPPSAVMVDHNGVGFCSTIAQWISSSGFDTHAVTGDPLLTSTFALGSGSSAVGKATNLTSLGIAALNSDKSGHARPRAGAWDIGAYQYCMGSACTTPDGGPPGDAAADATPPGDAASSNDGTASGNDASTHDAGVEYTGDDAREAGNGGVAGNPGSSSGCACRAGRDPSGPIRYAPAIWALVALALVRGRRVERPRRE